VYPWRKPVEIMKKHPGQGDRGMCIKVRKDEVRGQGTVELAKRELL